MDLRCTRAFDKTYKNYKSNLNDEEYKVRLVRYIKEQIPIKPPRYRYRQIVNVGGSRSSKSYSILQLLLVEMMTRRGIKITVWRNMKNVCRQTVREDFQKIIQFDKGVYRNFKENKQEGTFTYLPTGSRIIFEGADNIGKVLGSAQDISFFNEVTEFNREVYLQITQRTSDRVFCDYNPSKDFWLEKYRFDDETLFLHSTFKDNAYCPPPIVRQLMSYEPWLSGSYELINGELSYKGKPISERNQPPPHESNVKKGTADVFMWMVYGLGLQAEKPNKIYKGWNKIDLEFFESLAYKSYFGLDFGSSNPTACVEVKYDGNDSMYICPRMYKPINDLDSALPTAIQTRVPQIRKGKDFVVADSAKKAYLRALKQAGYLAVGAAKGSGSIGFGIHLVQGFTIYFVVTPEFLNEYLSYSWETDRYDKSTDTPIKKDDHFMDALRYIIEYLVRHLSIKI